MWMEGFDEDQFPNVLFKVTWDELNLNVQKYGINFFALNKVG